MKKVNLISILIGALIIVSIFAFQQKNPWTEKQLIAPEVLAKQLNDSIAKQPVVYNIGPAGNIKNAIEIGSTQEKESIEKLKTELSKLPRNTEVVIYCGCCPFTNCPNIRPAFNLLNEMKFTKHKLLNIEQNLKTNWIDKGYPMQK